MSLPNFAKSSHKAIVFPKRVSLPNKTNGFGLFQKMFTVVLFFNWTFSHKN